MAVTAAYFLSLELSYLREAINKSKLWRALVASPNADWNALSMLADAGSSSESNGRAAIRRGVLNDDYSHPLCLVRHLSDQDLMFGSSTGFDTTGTMLVMFEAEIPQVYRDTESYEDAYIWWENVNGGIVEEVKEYLVASLEQLMDAASFSLNTIGLLDPDEFPDKPPMMHSRWMVTAQGAI